MPRLLSPIISLLVAAAATVVFAQGEPSLDDTKEFIKRRAPEFGTFRFHFTPTAPPEEAFPTTGHISLSIEFEDNGMMTLQEHYYNEIDRRNSRYKSKRIIHRRTDNVTVRLSELNAVSAIEPWSHYPTACDVRIACIAKGCFKGKRASSAEFDNDETSNFDRDLAADKWGFSFSNAEQCRRMQTAFSHLILKSGGKSKKDPF